MISAEQARNMEISLTEQDLNDLEYIEENVIRAISKQDKGCWCYLDLSPRVIVELMKLGYQVKSETTQRDGESYQISW